MCTGRLPTPYFHWRERAARDRLRARSRFPQVEVSDSSQADQSGVSSYKKHRRASPAQFPEAGKAAATSPQAAREYCSAAVHLGRAVDKTATAVEPVDKRLVQVTRGCDAVHVPKGQLADPRLHQRSPRFLRDTSVPARTHAHARARPSPIRNSQRYKFAPVPQNAHSPIAKRQAKYAIASPERPASTSPTGRQRSRMSARNTGSANSTRL